MRGALRLSMTEAHLLQGCPLLVTWRHKGHILLLCRCNVHFAGVAHDGRSPYRSR